MTVRHLFSFGAAGCALAAAAPALAQSGPTPEMTYEQRTYQYAQPVPTTAEVVYRQQPVVQRVPEEYREYDPYYEQYEVEYRQAPPAAAPYPAYRPAPPHRQQGYHYPAPQSGYAPLPADFDREAWLDDCREGYRNPRRRNSGAVGGGILGAAVGGVIGNRVADGNRLAGTLIGAGVGGLAGLAIGSAIAGSGDRRRAREACEAWLDDYMAGRYRGGYGHQAGYAYPGYGYGHGYAQGYGYGYGHYGYAMHMTYVPVLVAVPQRAVVRETVTEEWVEEETRSYRKPSRRVIYRKAPAPKPAKRTKYTKSR